MRNHKRFSSHSNRPVQAKPEIPAAAVSASVSVGLGGGLWFIAKGILVFENVQFEKLIDASVAPPGVAGTPTLRSQLFVHAIAWNQEPFGTRGGKTYRLADRQGQALVFECRFKVAPYDGETGPRGHHFASGGGKAPSLVEVISRA